MRRKPFTVVLGPTDSDPKLTVHLVTGSDPDAAIQAAMKEAQTTHVEDAVVFPGHHTDLRKTNAAIDTEPDLPVFPEAFVLEGCARVKDARRLYPDMTDADLKGFAVCAFENRGFGVQCQECKLRLTTPCAPDSIDAKYLEPIKAYYKAVTDPYVSS
jgi:hypothetical protein